MNADKLFEAIGAMDEDILERSEYAEPKRRFRLLEALAACFVLLSCLSVVAVLVKNRSVTPTGDQPSVSVDGQRISYEPYYNQAFPNLLMAENLYYMDFLLTEKEMEGFLPDTQEDWMDFTAVYQSIIDRPPAENRLHLNTPTTIEDEDIRVVLGDYPQDYGVSENAVIYRCGEVDYTLWQSEYSGFDMWTIGAYATIHGMPAYFRMDVATEDLDHAKADLEALLLCFSEYPADRLDFSGFVATTQPHSWRLSYTREEICKESAYGIFLPEEDDKVYTNPSIIWDYFEDYTSITVKSHRDEEQYMTWLIEGGAEELITVIRNDSIPCLDAQELTLEAVKQAIAYSKHRFGQECYFCVDYGDAVISVDAKGISAEWLYDQLIAARYRQELSTFQTMVAIGQLEGVSLKIYYVDPTILTFAPTSAEELKTWSYVKTICVDDQTLLAHGDSLLKLSVSGFRTTEGEAYENARMCYVFEDAQGNTLLQVSFNGPDPDHVYVNSHPAKYDPMYMDIIQPFLTEEFYDTWKYPQ